MRASRFSSRLQTFIKLALGGLLAVVACVAVVSTGRASAVTAIWSSTTVINGSPGGTGTFAGVSCSDATDCTAVGYDGNDQPIYATESGGTWGTATEVSGSPGGAGSFSYFAGVSCSEATDCTAVGEDGNDQSIYATESGGTWGTPTEVTGSPGNSEFAGVSCSDATDCTAVGSDGSDQPIYATESGGTWGTATVVTGSSGNSYFEGVSCSDATDCTAVGNDGNGQAIYDTESGGVWGTPTEVDVPTTERGQFVSVSCSDTTDCTAVGNLYIGGVFKSMYATESGGIWGAVTEDSDSATYSEFSGVSCSDATDCTAVGNDGSGPSIYATESGGIWGTPTGVTGSPSGLAFFGVSCSDANDCTAVGENSKFQPIYARATPPPLDVSQLVPASGATAGGTQVAIIGVGFSTTPGTTSFAFGSGQATNVSCASSTVCTAYTPPEGAGGVTVKATTGGQTSTAGPTYTYTYGASFLYSGAPPTVATISPSTGTPQGGTTVTITGTHFTGAFNVAFGSTPASVTSVTATKVVAVSPAGSGQVEVVVTTPGGPSAITSLDHFTYLAPSVTKISPKTGSSGTTVTVTGKYFNGVTGVSFGTVPATSISFVSSTSIKAVAPPGTGVANVKVTTPSGTSPVVTADRFTY